MKDIEKIIKESIEQYEAPYNPDAWSKLSSRMDATPAVASTASSFKWLWIAASAVVAVSALSFWYFTNENESSTTEKTQIQLTENETKSKQIQGEQNISADEDVEDNNQSIEKQEFTPQKSSTYEPKQLAQTAVDDHFAFEDRTDGSKTPEVKSTFKLPLVSGNLCVGSEISISNLNEIEVGILCNGRLIQYIAPKSNTKLKLASAGTYSYSKKSEIFAAFEVKDTPKIDFVADELLYDNGLPFNHLKAIGSATSFEWVNKKGDILSTQREFDAHFYTKGSHEVVLKAKLDGCVTSVKKAVEIETEYNLLAVTGFNPEHPDPRRQTFVPYALLVRNVSFHLSIIDPKTGAVVYTTSDASQPWDGRDKRTGELVPANASYIWKVTLFNPEPNEKSEYKGIIVRI